MELIRTVRKETLPKGFSYPANAQMISEALQGTVQSATASITFTWRDEFWASKYRARVQAAGSLKVCDLNFDLWKEWSVFVHAVPAQHARAARDQMPGALRSLAEVLLRTPLEPQRFRWAANFDLATGSLRIAE